MHEAVTRADKKEPPTPRKKKKKKNTRGHRIMLIMKVPKEEGSWLRYEFLMRYETKQLETTREHGNESMT